MKVWHILSLLLVSSSLTGQVNTFPYTESFEEAFTLGSNSIFISNWTGNTVANSNRIHQGSDARTGTSSLNIVPISSFSGEIQVSLNLTGINNPKMSFYAYSKKNGSSSSSRPAILKFSTSIDGGATFLGDQQIGDDVTFPNDNSTSYAQYSYELPTEATNEVNVMVRIIVTRGSGSGSAAELIMDDFLIEPQNLALEISSAISTSPTSVVVTFNQSVTQASGEEPSNYALNSGITISKAQLIGSNQVELTSSELSNAQYSLMINNIVDSATNTLHNGLKTSFSFIQALAINAIQVLDKLTLEIEFNLALEKESAENSSNYTVNFDIRNPISVQLMDSGKRVRLSFSNAFDENEYEMNINEVRDKSTLAITSNLASTFNYLPLLINAVTAKSATEIELAFNQAVENTSATASSNYTIDYGIGNPINVVQTSDDVSRITLILERPMVNNTYTLTIDNVKNGVENAQTDKLAVSIAFVAVTHPRQIVINEVFADPSGDNQPDPLVLPNDTGDEYVELYNVSSNAIDIGNFELSGGRINTFVLAPKSYVILTASSNSQDFEQFGDVVSVTSWNTLSNGGEQLQLQDNLGNIVDSLTYNQDWYHDHQKADGGWSIAQVNPELSCSDIDNWRASLSSSGGSPGSTNSILDTTPDTRSPNLVSTVINSDKELVLVFDELMDVGSLTNASYSLDNGVNISLISHNSSSTRSIILSLDQPMTSGLKYTITVSGATDCVGNNLAINESNFLFDNLPPVLEHIVLKDSLTIDLLFDEVLSTNGLEDRANYIIQPQGVEASKVTLDNVDLKRIHLSLSAGLLLDSIYTLTYQNLSDTLNNTIENASFSFSFENQIDTVIVVSNHLLDIYFKESLQLGSAEAPNNYFVSNDINHPETTSLDTENDHLLHVIFNNNFPENRFLTISFENVFDSQNNRMQLFNTPFVYDTDDPDVDTLVVLNENSLQVFFDESLDITSAESINNYQLSDEGNRPVLATLSNDKTSVTLQFLSTFEPEKTYKLTLTGVKDLYANRISTNRNYSFVFDLIPPELVELNLLSPKAISLTFSEDLDKIIAESVSNYEVGNNIGNPISAKLSKRNPKVVELWYDDLGNNEINLLEISNISDLHGNAVLAHLTVEFSSQKPSLGLLEVLTDTSMRVQFSKVLTQASAQNLANYSLEEDLVIDTIFQDEVDGSIITINFTTPMIENIEYTLSVANLIDNDGNMSDLLSHDFVFENFIAGIQIHNPNTIVIDFKAGVSETESETPTNYYLTGEMSYPLSAVRNSDVKNQVTLFFDQPLQSDQHYTLGVKNLKDMYEDDVPFSSFDFAHDVSPPDLAAVNSVYLNEIEVVFNESIDPITSTTLNHYALNGQIEPTEISFLENIRNTVALKFLDNLSDDTSYILTVKRVQDLSQNEMENSAFDFVFKAPKKPVFRDIVINEVYFNTDQDAPLPNREFIEVYNRSDESFLLTDFILTDKRDSATLPSISLTANSHLILTTRAGENDYAILGNTLGLGGFPSLSNAGETIVLLDRDHNVIDSLGYDQSYYNDTDKVGGGFTIELINPNKHCFDISNYRASNDDFGGTPGRRNSVFDESTDSTLPLISSLHVNSTNQLSVSFNEAMDISSITQDKFLLSDDVSISDIDLIDDFGKEILINLAEPFTKGEVYTISVSGVVDCSGNQISDTSLDFAQGAPPQPGELIFTEIMASPSPSQGLPEVEYLEVLNISDKILSFSGVILSDATNSTILDAFDLNPGEYLILSPAVSASQFSGFGQVLAVNSWPSLNNATDKISLHNPSGNQVYSIQYDDSWYKSATKAEGGFSLEIIDPRYPCLLEINWTGSESSFGGSPGAINSVNGDNPDLRGPEIINAISIDQSTVQIDFNERLNKETIELGNFSTDAGLGFIALSINNGENSVTLTTDVDLAENTVYQITGDNITDCSGNLINPDNNSVSLIVAGKAEPLDILINELLFNPKPGGVRFVEIYNNSQKYLNLKNWKISGLSNQKTISEDNLFISPNSFLTITNSGSILSSHYPNARTQTFIEISSMPSLPSDAGSIFLRDENDIEIDGLDYDEDYHSFLISNYDGVSLERLRFSGISNDPSNWFSAASTSNNATPGYENSQSSPLATSIGLIIVDPPAFAPGIPGSSDFTTINYSFKAPGNVINLKIMSADGKLIKQLAQNAVVGTKGFFRWDGATTRGTKARIGYYMIVVEVISHSGKISYLLDKVAIGGRFQPH